MILSPLNTRSITTTPSHYHVRSRPSATVTPYDRFTCLVTSLVCGVVCGDNVTEKIAFISFFGPLLYTTILNSSLNR